MPRWPNWPHTVHATQIAAWRKHALEHLSEVFDYGSAVLEDAERHIRDLRAMVGELTMERDFLAGALGRFGLPSAKTMVERESKVTILRKCGLRDRCRSSLYYQP